MGQLPNHSLVKGQGSKTFNRKNTIKFFNPKVHLFAYLGCGAVLAGVSGEKKQNRVQRRLQTIGFAIF